MTVQKITTEGGETLVVLALAEYEKLLEAAEDAADAAKHAAIIRGLRHREEELFTPEEADRFVAAPTPLAFYRQHRGFTQASLAKKAGISQSYVAGLEAGGRKGDPALFKRLAKILSVQMERLVAD